MGKRLRSVFADMANTVIKMNSGEIKEIIKNKEIKDASELRWA